MKQVVFIADEVCAEAVELLKADLGGEAALACSEERVRFSQELLELVPRHALKVQPDVVALCAGRVDTKQICVGDGERVTPLDHFGRNVRRALELVLQRSTAIPVLVTTTPIDQKRKDNRDEKEAVFGYDNETISLYNEEAKAIAENMGVAFIDLYGKVKMASRADSTRPDGIHFDDKGKQLLAKALAEGLHGLLSGCE